MNCKIGNMGENSEEAEAEILVQVNTWMTKCISGHLNPPKGSKPEVF